MTSMVGRLVTLSDLIKPVSKYIEDNVGFPILAEDMYKHGRGGTAGKSPETLDWNCRY